MSDTVAAIAIAPVLIALTLCLEGLRIGCTWAVRRYRGAGSAVAASGEQAMPQRAH